MKTTYRYRQLIDAVYLTLIIVLEYLDWIPVTRSDPFIHDLENQPFWIRTDSEPGDGNQVVTQFFVPGGVESGGIRITFNDPMEVRVSWCETELVTDPPGTREKVWKITLDRTQGIRITVHCNGVEVLNVVVSVTGCDGDDGWQGIWPSKTVASINFHYTDDASDYYSLTDPNGTNFQYMVCLLYTSPSPRD